MSVERPDHNGDPYDELSSAVSRVAADVSREINEKARGGYAHNEAFCHMLYRTDDGRLEEWIWNSRDGVTPFVISAGDGREMKHVDWNRDRRDILYVPKIGERIFVDMTVERVRELTARNVDRWWDDPKLPACDSFPDKDTMFERLLLPLLDELRRRGPGPDLIVVDEATQAFFGSRAAANGALSRPRYPQRYA